MIRKEWEILKDLHVKTYRITDHKKKKKRRIEKEVQERDKNVSCLITLCRAIFGSFGLIREEQ